MSRQRAFNAKLKDNLSFSLRATRALGKYSFEVFLLFFVVVGVFVFLVFCPVFVGQQSQCSDLESLKL